MAKRSDMDHGLLLLIVAILAWIIPGAGHFFIKERKRALIIFITITATFTVGLSIGSIAIIDPVGAWPWYIGQMITSPSVAVLGKTAQKATGKWNQAKQLSQQAAQQADQLERLAKQEKEDATLQLQAQQAKQESTLLTQKAQDAVFASYGKAHDFGQIYTAIAGALNLLAILSAVYMAHSGRGEMIGREEDE